MKRLTKRLPNGRVAVFGCGDNCKYAYKYCYSENTDCPTLEEIYEKLAFYEDLEEEGRLVVLSIEDIYPCKNCNRGWGQATSNGFKSCYENCGKLREYKKKYNL